MRKKFSLLLDGTWTLEHRTDDPLPIAKLKKELDRTMMVQCGRATFVSLDVFFNDDRISVQDVEALIRSTFQRQYPEADGERLLHLTVSEPGQFETALPLKMGHGGDWTDPDGTDELDPDEDDEFRSVGPQEPEKSASEGGDASQEGESSERPRIKKPSEESEEEAEQAIAAIIAEARAKAQSSDDDSDDDDFDDDDEEAPPVPESPRARLEALRARNAEQRRQEEIKKSGAEKVLRDADALIGAAEFKALMREIAAVAPALNRRDALSVFERRTFLFSIGDGCGLSTYLNLMAMLLIKAEVRKVEFGDPVHEMALGPYKDTMEPFADVMHALETVHIGREDILCIDISEWIDRMENRNFRKFLRAAEKGTQGHVVVFRVPFVEKDVLENVRRSLADLLSVQTVSFPPFTQGELRAYAQKRIAEYGFRMTRSAWAAFEQRVTEEKCDGRFYGLNTIEKVVRELVYDKLLAESRRPSSENVIGIRDAAHLCVLPKEDSVPALTQLDRLVGCKSVKQQLLEIVTQIELAKKTSSERPCIHMRFVGNPGTGKTTVARILGKLMRERGLLRIGRFFEYAGRDFCGKYIGETAPKTASICRDAYGSVLFIDEAYSLYRGDNNDRDYGREAIDTLIAEMENHRDDFVVIMAGYTDEMEKLMEGNQGLKSRMPFTVEFPAFTREELGEIYVSVAKERFACEENLFDAAREYFLGLPDELLASKEFSNARFVRNLFERTWAKAAMRCQLSGKEEIALTKDDFERAIGEKDFAFHVSKKPRLGF